VMVMVMAIPSRRRPHPSVTDHVGSRLRSTQPNVGVGDLRAETQRKAVPMPLFRLSAVGPRTASFVEALQQRQSQRFVVDRAAEKSAALGGDTGVALQLGWAPVPPAGLRLLATTATRER
jgi:hypothetical protein